jgi:hypothetical protein
MNSGTRVQRLTPSHQLPPAMPHLPKFPQRPKIQNGTTTSWGPYLQHMSRWETFLIQTITQCQKHFHLFKHESFLCWELHSLLLISKCITDCLN